MYNLVRNVNFDWCKEMEEGGEDKCMIGKFAELYVLNLWDGVGVLHDISRMRFLDAHKTRAGFIRAEAPRAGAYAIWSRTPE